MTRSAYTAGQFCWVDLVAHDMTSAGEFYAELFDWTVETQDTAGGPPYAMFFQNGDVVAGIGEMSDEMRENGVPPTWNSYVSVDDVHEVTESAQELGATIVTSPMQVMEAGWLAFIQDPTGATLGLWQAGAHHGATRMNEPGSFCWNDLNTRDPETAKEFYSALFGWTYEENRQSEGNYFVIHNDGRPNGGLLEMTEEWGDTPPHWSVYFAVEDLDHTADQVGPLGGNIHDGPFETPVGPMTVTVDPQGAFFYLIELTDDAM